VVTDIDLAVERLLIDAISAREPTATFLSEESHPDPAALASNRCFVIDPIDGTEEFAAGRPNYANVVCSSVRIAEIGLRTPRAGARTRALCAVRAAHAHARIGNRGATERLLAEMHQLVAQDSTEPFALDVARHRQAGTQSQVW
jgi:3'-phosphoadenosine 5'-phosphosulfate (PAPS) 3'-phosphatase